MVSKDLIKDVVGSYLQQSSKFSDTDKLFFKNIVEICFLASGNNQTEQTKIEIPVIDEPHEILNPLETEEATNIRNELFEQYIALFETRNFQEICKIDVTSGTIKF